MQSTVYTVRMWDIRWNFLFFSSSGFTFRSLPDGDVLLLGKQDESGQPYVLKADTGKTFTLRYNKIVSQLPWSVVFKCLTLRKISFQFFIIRFYLCLKGNRLSFKQSSKLFGNNGHRPQFVRQFQFCV